MKSQVGLQEYIHPYVHVSQRCHRDESSLVIMMLFHLIVFGIVALKALFSQITTLGSAFHFLLSL